MRTVAIVLLLAALSPAGVALAHDHHAHGFTIGRCEARPPVDWGARQDQSRARFVMLTDDRSAEMLLTRDVVAVQLSDRTLRRIDREFERERDEEDGALADAIKGAVLGGVRAMLDHSLACPVRELRDVRLRDGRLELIDRDGHRVFDDLEVDDHDLLECFAPEDARAFVEEFRSLKAHER